MDFLNNMALCDKHKRIADELFVGRTADRCLVIGSNPSLRTVRLAEYVDSFKGDVIRINKLAHPECKMNYGSRTDILFACKWSDEHVVCEDFNPKIVIDDDLILDISRDFKENTRPNLTTGMICILLALQKYAHVELLGFGVPELYESGNYRSVWEEDTRQNTADPRFKHDMNFEHRLLWSLARHGEGGRLEMLEAKLGPAQHKQAFALYARGQRYLAYQHNVEMELKKYVPDADIVVIDPIKACDCLPDIPERSGEWNWDKSIFMRLAIPLMDDFDRYDRVVWLDVDVDIVSSKFASILDVATSSDGLAAVKDSGEAGLMKWFRRSFPEAGKAAYCNSGVLVMDLRKIDKEAWRRKIWAGIEKHLREGLKFPDQDILNAYFDIRTIDERYNTFSRDLSKIRAPWLVHYVAPKGKLRLDAIVREKQNMNRASRTSLVPRAKSMPTIIDRPRAYNSSPASREELAELADVMVKIRARPAWGGILSEVSLAEELRLLGVRGWRVVWNDLKARWRGWRGHGSGVPACSSEAAKVIEGYRTSSSKAEARSRIRESLRRMQ